MRGRVTGPLANRTQDDEDNIISFRIHGRSAQHFIPGHPYSQQHMMPLPVLTMFNLPEMTFPAAPQSGGSAPLSTVSTVASRIFDSLEKASQRIPGDVGALRPPEARLTRAARIAQERKADADQNIADELPAWEASKGRPGRTPDPSCTVVVSRLPLDLSASALADAINRLTQVHVAPSEIIFVGESSTGFPSNAPARALQKAAALSAQATAATAAATADIAHATTTSLDPTKAISLADGGAAASNSNPAVDVGASASPPSGGNHGNRGNNAGPMAPYRVPRHRGLAFIQLPSRGHMDRIFGTLRPASTAPPPSSANASAVPHEVFAASSNAVVLPLLPYSQGLFGLPPSARDLRPLGLIEPEYGRRDPRWRPHRLGGGAGSTRASRMSKRDMEGALAEKVMAEELERLAEKSRKRKEAAAARAAAAAGPSGEPARLNGAEAAGGFAGAAHHEGRRLQGDHAIDAHKHPRQSSLYTNGSSHRPNDALSPGPRGPPAPSGGLLTDAARPVDSAISGLPPSGLRDSALVSDGDGFKNVRPPSGTPLSSPSTFGSGPRLGPSVMSPGGNSSGAMFTGANAPSVWNGTPHGAQGGGGGGWGGRGFAGRYGGHDGGRGRWSGGWDGHDRHGSGRGHERGHSHGGRGGYGHHSYSRGSMSQPTSDGPAPRFAERTGRADRFTLPPAPAAESGVVPFQSSACGKALTVGDQISLYLFLTTAGAFE